MKRFVFNGKASWKCLSKKEMSSKYPEMGYKISGEVTRRKGKKNDYVLKKGERTLPVQPIGTYKKPFYKVHGFISDTEQDVYIVVKKSNLLNGLIFLLGVILLAFVSFIFLKQENDTFLDENAKAFQSDIKRDKDWGDSRILIPGFETLYMDEGSDELYVALVNPEGNPCYFQYSVFMEGSDKEILKTGMIPPGQAITTVKMPDKMKRGSSELTIKIRAYSLDDHETELNGAEMKTTLIVVGK